MDTLRAAGAADGVAYVMAAETSGPRELDFLLALGMSRSEVLRDIEAHRVARWEQVIVPNADDAAAASRHARVVWPELLVLNLAGLDIRRWRDDPSLLPALRTLHTHLKDMVFESFARVVVTGPGWAYAAGERQRVNRALRDGLPICDPQGHTMSLSQLQAAVDEADETIRERLGGHPVLMSSIDEVLPAVSIGS